MDSLEIGLSTKISILENIGFHNCRGDLWDEVMAIEYRLPKKGKIIPFGFFAAVFIGRTPEYLPGLGMYFLIGGGPHGSWEVLPSAKAINESGRFKRTVPLGFPPFVICLVDNPPKTWTEKILIKGTIKDGITKGEYFQPVDTIFESYCTTA